MGKFGIYLGVSSGIMVIFYFAGLLENTASSGLLQLLLDPISFQSSSLVSKIGAAVTGVGIVAAISVGILTRNLDLVATGPVAILIFNLGWDFIAVVSVISSRVNPILAVIIFSGLFYMWVVTVIEWWRGITT